MPTVVLIVLTAVLAADFVWWRQADRRACRWPRAAVWRLLIALFVGGQLVVVVWTFAGRDPEAFPPGRPPQVLSAAAYLWHLLVLPATAVVAAGSGLARRGWRLGRRLAGRPAAEAPPEPAGTATRREFLGMAATAAPVLLTGAGAVFARSQLQEFRVRPITVALPGLPPELDGVRVALVSDLHQGTFTRGPTVRRVVEEASRLDADLVLLPGDLINNALADLSDALDAVANMQSRHGAYLSVGNHDLIEDGAEFVRRVKARANLLVDEGRVVTVRGYPVQLLGLPWELGDARIADSVRRLAARRAPGAFPILLAHHPHAFDAAAAAGLPLTVSGHTHGGQLMLPGGVGFGPLMYRYWSGLYQKPGANLVVSNGVGNWFPLRTGAPAEIIELTLRAAAGDEAAARRGRPA